MRTLPSVNRHGSALAETEGFADLGEARDVVRENVAEEAIEQAMIWLRRELVEMAFRDLRSAMPNGEKMWTVHHVTFWDPDGFSTADPIALYGRLIQRSSDLDRLDQSAPRDYSTDCHDSLKLASAFYTRAARTIARRWGIKTE